MGNRTRNMAIELMRCVMMFEIVFLHIMTQNGWFEQGGLFARHLLNVLLTGVEGFVFISGYYGIRFSVAKVARLLGLFVFYTVLFAAPSWNWRYVFSHKLTHNWFLFAYLVLMAFASAFNAALEGRSKRQILAIALPIIVAVYGWSYLSVIPVVKGHVPVVT